MITIQTLLKSSKYPPINPSFWWRPWYLSDHDNFIFYFLFIFYPNKEHDKFLIAFFHSSSSAECCRHVGPSLSSQYVGEPTGKQRQTSEGRGKASGLGFQDFELGTLPNGWTQDQVKVDCNLNILGSIPRGAHIFQVCLLVSWVKPKWNYNFPIKIVIFVNFWSVQLWNYIAALSIVMNTLLTMHNYLFMYLSTPKYWHIILNDINALILLDF